GVCPQASGMGAGGLPTSSPAPNEEADMSDGWTAEQIPDQSRPTTTGVTMTASSTQGIKTVLHPVSDLASAKAVYAALLGVPPQADSDYYVGFEAEGQHIGLLPGGGPQGMTSPVAY